MASFQLNVRPYSIISGVKAMSNPMCKFLRSIPDVGQVTTSYRCVPYSTLPMYKSFMSVPEVWQVYNSIGCDPYFIISFVEAMSITMYNFLRSALRCGANIQFRCVGNVQCNVQILEECPRCWASVQLY